MRRLLWTAFFLCCSSAVRAQPPDTLWTRSYGTSVFEECLAVRQTADGGYLLAGRNFIPNVGEDLVMIRINADGDSLWSRAINVEFRDQVRAMVGCGEDAFVISLGQCLVKVNSEADSLWTVCAPGNPEGWDFSTAHSLEETGDGNIIGGGLSWFWNYVGGHWYLEHNRFLAKFDTSGNLLWSREYWWDPRSSAATRSTADGGFVIALYVESPGLTGMRTDNVGSSIWERSYGDWRDCELSEINVLSLSEGGFIFAAPAPHQGGEPIDYRLVRTNENGDTLWTRLIGGFSLGLIAVDMYEIDQGDLLLTGMTSEYDFRLVRTNASGDTLWTKSWESPLLGTIYSSSCLTSDGGIIMVGRIGQSPGDFYAVRVAPFLSTPQRPRTRNLTFDMHQNFPNPFNSSTEVRFDLPRAGHVTLNVYDITGREVAKIADQEYTAGSHAVNFDAAHLPSGLYFARLSAGEISQTQKMVLLK